MGYNNIFISAITLNLVVVLWSGRVVFLFLGGMCRNLGMNIVSLMNSKMFHENISNNNVFMQREQMLQNVNSGSI